jgi:histone deacetylase 1/2
MENSNSRDYLDKIKSAVIDNLRQTGPAPSVQMQDVPRKPFGGMTDEEEAELDDLDEDENKDVRMTEHQWDKHIEHGAEFEPSDDDDDMARKHGATRPKDKKRTFTDFRKGEMEVDSGNGSPAPDTNDASAEGPTPEETHDINDDTIEDISAQEPTEKEQPEDKEVEKTVETPKETEKTGVDVDGDVGMTDSAPAEETTTIKKEDVEPEAAPEKAPTETPAEEEPAVKETTPQVAAKEPTPESKSPKDAPEKPTEVLEEKAKEAEPVDAMDVDTEKDKPEEAKKKSKSPEH